ncbi:MAG: enoyl-CoA hydratase/isomerase family protein [Acidimicrobiia bacterium]
MSDTVLLDVRDGVAHVTLNRPDDANAITPELASDLLAAATAIELDPSVRAVLLSGAGKRFCGGGDVRGFHDAGDALAGGVRLLIPELHNAISMLVRGDAPVVAAVHGSAAGAGMGFVGMSDIVVAGESTKFVMAYTQIGLSPDGSSSWFLPRVVGLKRALELTLTNRVLSAQEALDFGLITTVVPDADVLNEAGAIAAKLASGPTIAYGIAKRLLHTSLEDTLETHLAREADGFARASTTRDAREGIAAFVEKRPPEFTGQ